MSEVLTKIVVNCETGVSAQIPLTSEELAQREIDIAAAEEARVAREADEAAKAALKASAKAKLVAGQPLTPEEAATIIF